MGTERHKRMMHAALINALALGVGAEAMPIATQRTRVALRITLPRGDIQHYKAPDDERMARAAAKRARKAGRRG